MCVLLQVPGNVGWLRAAVVQWTKDDHYIERMMLLTYLQYPAVLCALRAKAGRFR